MAQEQSRVELKFDDDLQKPGFWRIGRTEGGNITFFGFCFTRISSRQRAPKASNSSSSALGLCSSSHCIFFLHSHANCKPLHSPQCVSPHTHTHTDIRKYKVQGAPIRRASLFGRGERFWELFLRSYFPTGHCRATPAGPRPGGSSSFIEEWGGPVCLFLFLILQKVSIEDFPSAKYNTNLDSINIFRMTLDAYIYAEKHSARNTA